MHHIIYISRASSQLTPMELIALLLQARDKNARENITGALVYGNGQFMQVIEGEEAALTTLYERILADSRHRDVFKLADKAITERSFLNWSMAFREVSPGEFEDLVGYVSPAQWEQLSFGSNSADTLLLERMQELVHFAR